MKKYYDKVLFLLSLVVLGIGATFFYLKGGVPQRTPDPLVSKPLTGNAFDNIPAPEFEDTHAVWDSPPDQGADGDPGWIYSVFTPPKIWWQDGDFSPQPPKPIAQIPFGIHLVGIKQDLYRIQLAYSAGAAGEGDAKDVVTFTDEDSGYDFQLSVGEESKKHEIKLTDYHVERVDKGHGIISSVAKVTILDERTNETVTLTQDTPYSPTNNEFLVLQTDDPFPAQEWHVSKDGDKLDVDKGIYFVATKINFDNPSVTVEKHSPSKKDPRRDIVTHRDLVPVDTSTPPTTSKTSTPSS